MAIVSQPTVPPSWAQLPWRAVRSVARACLPQRARKWLNWMTGRHRYRWLPESGLAVTPELIAESPAHGADLYLPRTTTYDVIVLPIIDWEFRFQRPQHLARQFAAHGHRVFYPRTAFSPAGLSVRPHGPNLAEVTLPGPVRLNLYQHQASRRVIDRWVAAFDDLAQEFGIAEAVCLVQLPFWADLAVRLRDRFGWKVVYDCMDKHSGFSTNDPAMLRNEETLTRESDLVVTTARTLYDEQSRHAARCVLVPNGCEFDHFANPAPVPPEVANLPRPVVGYYGAISDWFDTALVARMARSRPQWSFALVGSTYGADLAPLAGLPNVHLLGEKPYATLPGYVNGFDVCLIPFRITPLTEATNPVKFYEHMASGKPVVSTRLPELVPYAAEGHVALGDTADELVRGVEAALVDSGPAAVAGRRQLARENTWEARFRTLDGAVRKLYPRASLIVLTFNNLAINRLCIESILRNTLRLDYELIVVDNASKDGTPDYLRSLAKVYPQMKLILNETNKGFAGGNNQGIRAATGEYVVLLNNDTILPRGWLGRLLRHLERDPKAGLVGPVTTGAANEAYVAAQYKSLAAMEAFAQKQFHTHAGETFPIAVPALFCAAARRALFDEVGLLDERYEIGLFEDDDLALRVRRAGYKTLCARDVFVHHFQCEGFKQFGDAGYLKLFRANRERFEKKWGVPWEQHRRGEAA